MYDISILRTPGQYGVALVVLLFGSICDRGAAVVYTSIHYTSVYAGGAG